MKVGCETRVGGADIFLPSDLEEQSMPRSRDELSARAESRRPRKRRRREKSQRSHARHASRVPDGAELEGLDESLLDAEERAYLEARRAAEDKVQLWGKFWKLTIVVVPLMVFLPWLAFIVLFIGGVDLAKRAYRILYEPRLRERFVDEEVSKRVRNSVHEERRSLEGEHSRSLERLSASIAHEIRNPITAVKSLVQQMGEDPGGLDNDEYAHVALEELERVERSISHLLRFAREEEMRPVSLRMSEVLDSALETFRDRAARDRVEIVRRFDCEGSMPGDAEKLRRVVINLVGNAMDSLADSEVDKAGVDKPRIDVSLGEILAGTEIWLRIADNGRGIDRELSEKIFNPFYTSKEHGTGLGLPITKKLVEAHGGTIEVESVVGRGAEFVLTFPKELGARGAGRVPGGGLS
jgi:signal transduction histidine kinase